MERKINWSEIKDFSFSIRQNIVKTAENIKEQSHWGSNLSCVEILTVVYKLLSNIGNKGLPYEKQDKVIVSKGHAGLVSYLVLQEIGLLNGVQELFHGNGSQFSEELEMNADNQIVCSTGSLGIGVPYAVGLALLAKKRGWQFNVYVVCGDGECDEGVVWEALLFAAANKLDNITLFVDRNRLQLDGFSKDVLSLGDIEKKLDSFDWSVSCVDGHDESALFEAAIRNNTGKPKAIIADTVKGKGISFMENKAEWHDKLLSGKLLEQAKREMKLQ